MKTKPSLTFSKLDPETGVLLDRMFEKKDCMMEINPGRVILPADYMTIGQDILDMEVLESDVWMCSYPRTGEFFFVLQQQYLEIDEFSCVGNFVGKLPYQCFSSGLVWWSHPILERPFPCSGLIYLNLILNWV